jgi:hypothetical protein
LTLASAIGSPATFAATAGCDHGTWRGTLGRTPVSIELSPAEDQRPAMGRYYYRTSLGDLTLVRDAKTGEWQELDADETVTGRLTLRCEGETLTGEWRSADGVRKLPMAAVGIKPADYDATRRAALKPKVVKTGEVGGRRFEELSYPLPGDAGKKRSDTEVAQVGVRLSGTTPGIAAVNAALRRAATASVFEHLDCQAQGRRDRGPGAGYAASQTQSVTAWNAAFVVISTWMEGYCGGAHPWHSTLVTTYRLDSGAEADVKDWLPAALTDEIPKDSKLGKLLMTAYAGEDGNGQDAECRGEVSWRGSSLHPEPGQLVFHTQASYAMTPCAEDVALPIDVVWPYLTPAGRMALKTFR